MYKPPITIYQALRDSLNIQLENNVCKAVASYGINVDKDELIKALKYDREQYEKGYRDGKSECPEWIPIKFRETTDEDGFDKEEHPIMLDCTLPDNGEEVLVTTKSGHVAEDTFYDDDGAYLECYEWDEITAWMPLPEPYKEVDDETMA